jgi:hypothetical protein
VTGGTRDRPGEWKVVPTEKVHWHPSADAAWSPCPKCGCPWTDKLFRSCRVGKNDPDFT